MKKEFDIYNQTNLIYSKSKDITLISSFIVWVCVFLALLFPFFNFGFAFFIMCFLCIGFKSNVLQSLQGKSVKIENIFSFYKNCFTAFTLKITTMLLTMLWSLALLVPGILTGLNFAFAPYICAEDSKLGTLECMKKSKILVYGHRSEIFVVYLAEALLTLLIGLLLSSFMIILNYFSPVKMWLNVFVPMIITAFIFFVFVFPYFEMLVGNIYLYAKKLQEPKQKTAKTSSVK